MALTGELTDLSLAELIEFFCNQRKTGRLMVSYPRAPAYFYLVSGSVVHASIGELRGIEAVYYALTQSNANFNFSTAYEAPDHTINQPWTSVVLEGLRRMDEGIKPRNPFPGIPEPAAPKPLDKKPEPVAALASVAPAVAESTPTTLLADPAASVAKSTTPAESFSSPVIEDSPAPEVINPSKTSLEQIVTATTNKSDADTRSPIVSRPAVSDAFLSSTQTASRFSSGPWKVAAIFAALILIVAAVAVPWYARGRAAKAMNQQAQTPAESPTQKSSESAANNESVSQPADATQSPEEPSAVQGNSDATDAAKREREARTREEARLKAKAAETNGSATSTSQPPAVSPSNSTTPTGNGGPKKVVVQVTYDENGRVTQATGNDPTALRIARQKRFPPGKAGSATITIPIN